MRVRAGVVALAAMLAVPVGAGGVALAATPATTTQVLEGLGCFVGRVAGDGDRFSAAVVRFQAANRLEQTGKANRKTRARLAGERAKRCDDRAVPERSGEGRRLVLSQRQNWIWLVREDGTVAAQGGIVDNDWLPRKTYVTGDQCGRPGRARHRSSEDFSLRINYFVRFAECRVGFHEIPVRKSTGQPLHEDFYAGTDLRKSHGCLRVPYPLVRKLWRFTVEPTPVVVIGG
jgi:hypothetical protein